jgi:hypothetical protein
MGFGTTPEVPAMQKLSAWAGRHVFATEVEQRHVDSINARLAEEKITDVTTVLGDQSSTGLPESCCDRILGRRVSGARPTPGSRARSAAGVLEADRKTVGPVLGRTRPRREL